ncbi:hypothetical protein [Neolewinella persica]|uniref:hypothetical protein n=1 Tax=Neolewinella persica TaxID=70998 RepID=UPI0012F994A5|nr:hypothetical protein [Neolewinella persica]
MRLQTAKASSINAGKPRWYRGPSAATDGLETNPPDGPRSNLTPDPQGFRIRPSRLSLGPSPPERDDPSTVFFGKN